jgi:UDP-N-acetylglucosamine 1-carboxyvinyltransferase
LQNFLIELGVSIWGAGTSVIRIVGNNYKLRSVLHNVIPDRIVAGTYMVASAITGGDILIKNVIPEQINSVIYNLRDCGCRINVKRNMLRISGPARPRAIDIIRTLPYPGFPTDMQAQLISLLTIARGESIVVETVFENRYKHVDELIRMGANIKTEGRIAIIKGVKKLTGAKVCSKD